MKYKKKYNFFKKLGVLSLVSASSILVSYGCNNLINTTHTIRQNNLNNTYSNLSSINSNNSNNVNSYLKQAYLVNDDVLDAWNNTNFNDNLISSSTSTKTITPSVTKTEKVDSTLVSDNKNDTKTQTVTTYTISKSDDDNYLSLYGQTNMQIFNNWFNSYVAWSLNDTSNYTNLNTIGNDAFSNFNALLNDHFLIYNPNVNYSNDSSNNYSTMSLFKNTNTNPYFNFQVNPYMINGLYNISHFNAIFSNIAKQIIAGDYPQFGNTASLTAGTNSSTLININVILANWNYLACLVYTGAISTYSQFEAINSRIKGFTNLDNNDLAQIISNGLNGKSDVEGQYFCPKDLVNSFSTDGFVIVPSLIEQINQVQYTNINLFAYLQNNLNWLSKSDYQIIQDSNYGSALSTNDNDYNLVDTLISSANTSNVQTSTLSLSKIGTSRLNFTLYSTYKTFLQDKSYFLFSVGMSGSLNLASSLWFNNVLNYQLNPKTMYSIISNINFSSYDYTFNFSYVAQAQALQNSSYVQTNLDNNSYFFNVNLLSLIAMPKATSNYWSSCFSDANDSGINYLFTNNSIDATTIGNWLETFSMNYSYWSYYNNVSSALVSVTNNSSNNLNEENVNANSTINMTNNGSFIIDNILQTSNYTQILNTNINQFGFVSLNANNNGDDFANNINASSLNITLGLNNINIISKDTSKTYISQNNLSNYFPTYNLNYKTNNLWSCETNLQDFSNVTLTNNYYNPALNEGSSGYSVSSSFYLKFYSYGYNKANIVNSNNSLSNEWWNWTSPVSNNYTNPNTNSNLNTVSLNTTNNTNTSNSTTANNGTNTMWNNMIDYLNGTKNVLNVYYTNYATSNNLNALFNNNDIYLSFNNTYLNNLFNLSNGNNTGIANNYVNLLSNNLLNNTISSIFDLDYTSSVIPNTTDSTYTTYHSTVINTFTIALQSVLNNLFNQINYDVVNLNSNDNENINLSASNLSSNLTLILNNNDNNGFYSINSNFNGRHLNSDGQLIYESNSKQITTLKELVPNATIDSISSNNDLSSYSTSLLTNFFSSMNLSPIYTNNANGQFLALINFNSFKYLNNGAIITPQVPFMLYNLNYSASLSSTNAIDFNISNDNLLASYSINLAHILLSHNVLNNAVINNHEISDLLIILTALDNADLIHSNYQAYNLSNLVNENKISVVANSIKTTNDSISFTLSMPNITYPTNTINSYSDLSITLNGFNNQTSLTQPNATALNHNESLHNRQANSINNSKKALKLSIDIAMPIASIIIFVFIFVYLYNKLKPKYKVWKTNKEHKIMK